MSGTDIGPAGLDLAVDTQKGNMGALWDKSYIVFIVSGRVLRRLVQLSLPDFFYSLPKV